MSMYSTVEGTNVPYTNQPGVPNVSQYSWSAYETSEYKQLIEYVDEAREYVEQVKEFIQYVDVIKASIDDIKTEIDKLYKEIGENLVEARDIFGQIRIIYSSIVAIEAHVTEMTNQVSKDTQTVRDILQQVLALRDDILLIKAAVLASEQKAADSATASETSATKSAASAAHSEVYYHLSYDLYIDLKKGQVYRGTWNPNSGAYPTEKSTNSVWDVVLNENEVEHFFDGKKWYWGDRLIYVKTDDRFYQIEAGANVKSVNGKAGAVILGPADVGALPKTGTAVLTGNLFVVGRDEVVTMKGSAPGVPTYFMSRTHDDQPCWLVGKGGSNHDITFKSYPHDTEIVLKGDRIVSNKPLYINGDQVYSPVNKPTPSDLGTYNMAEIDAKDSAISSLFTNYYNKTEIDSALSLKANQADVVASLDNKVDKVTTVNGKPLISNITLGSDDVGALSKNGDTGTGHYVFEEDGPIISLKSKTPNSAAYIKGLDNLGNNAWYFGKGDVDDTLSWYSYKTSSLMNMSSDKFSFNKPLYVSGNRVYDTGFKPTPADIGAADMLDGGEIRLLTVSNPNRSKEVQIFSKEGRLYGITADGTKTQFYNDRSYRPTISDFGGLGVENGNELNIPSSSSDFYFGYRKVGASEIGYYNFMNGKSQHTGYAAVKASDFLVGVDGHRVYSPVNPPTSVVNFNNRDVKPNTAPTDGASITLFSNSNIGVQSDYSDLLVLNSWSDASAGRVNAIAAEKFNKALYHLQAEIGSDSWGTPDKIYTSANKPTNRDLGLVKDVFNSCSDDLNFTSDESMFLSVTGSNPNWAYPGSGGSLIQTSHGGYLNQLAFRSATPGLSFRTKDPVGGTWSPWAMIYSQLNKPSASEINALPVSGVALNETALGVRRAGGSIAFEVGEDSNPYISVDFTYKALGFNRASREASFEGKVTSPSSFSIAQHTSVGYRVLQTEVHSSGAMDITTSDGANWYYPLTFDLSNNVKSNGHISVKGGVHIPHSQSLSFNNDPRGTDGAGNAGAGWGISEDAPTGELGIHRYLSGVWQSNPFTVHNNDTISMISDVSSSGTFYAPSKGTGWGGRAGGFVEAQDWVDVANGEWRPLVTSALYKTSQGYLSRWSLGHYRTGLSQNGDCVLSLSGDGQLANGVRFHFTEFGGLSSPTSPSNTWWHIHTGGQLSGSIFGAHDNMVNWVSANFAPLSDERLKKNIKKSTKSALDDIQRFQFKSYDWKEETRSIKSSEIGLIAQEVEKVNQSYIKDVETYNPDGTVDTSVKILDVTNLLSLSLKANQELKQRLDKQSLQIEELRRIVESISTK